MGGFGREPLRGGGRMAYVTSETAATPQRPVLLGHPQDPVRPRTDSQRQLDTRISTLISNECSYSIERGKLAKFAERHEGGYASKRPFHGGHTSADTGIMDLPGNRPGHAMPPKSHSLMPFSVPDDFPPQCPPPDAEHVDTGTFYRFTKSNSPDGADFMRYRDEKPHVTYDTAEGICDSYGMSLFADMADVASMQRKLTKTLGRRHVAQADFENLDIGHLASTPSKANASHHTWWLPAPPPNVCAMFAVQRVQR